MPISGRGSSRIIRYLPPAGWKAAFLDFAKPKAACLRVPQRLLLRTWCGFWGLVLHGNHEV
ncbi:MAG: hypothetical protein ACXWXD_11810, partial [Candidatus Deferrimicrobiaceae bacterium]